MDYVLYIIVLISLYAGLTALLDLLVGHAGIMSFAHASIYGIGAYATAILTVYAGFDWLSATVAAMVICAAVSGLIGYPTLRLGGDYFVLALFGVQIVVVTIILNWEELTNGPFGIRGIPRPSFGFGPLKSGWPISLMIVAVVALILLAVWRLLHSPLKLRLHALRDDPTVAEAMGINVEATKITLFCLVGALVGLIGAMTAFYFRFIDVSGFSIHTMILILAMVYVGGTTTFVGPIIGAAVLIIFPEVFRFAEEFGIDRARAQEALYGLLMIVLMLYRPQGIAGSRETTPAAGTH